MHDAVSRRTFLEFVGGAAMVGGGAAFLAGCGGSKSSSTTTSISPLALQPRVVSSDLYASPTPQRLAFTVVTANNEPDAGKAARIALAAPGGGALSAFVPATARGKGLGQFRGVYTVDATLAKDGIWQAVVEYDGAQLALPLQVGTAPQVVTIGSKAPTAASPTKAKPLGAARLCTRTPACPLHTRSLDALVGKGRPVAVMFATPAYCQTSYCGEVLDAMLPLVPTYGAKVDFVHVEIYLDTPVGGYIPTVDAWKLPSEPWFFGIDGAGVVQARLDGAFDQTEMQTVVDALAKNQLHFEL